MLHVLFCLLPAVILGRPHALFIGHFFFARVKYDNSTQSRLVVEMGITIRNNNNNNNNTGNTLCVGFSFSFFGHYIQSYTDPATKFESRWRISSGAMANIAIRATRCASACTWQTQARRPPSCLWRQGWTRSRLPNPGQWW